ncbi:pre-rRNA 2'-O-ribose RNA methyltransferase-like [Zingiber officinale]|uniref:pre-rRNA 2'-O-ribose RNA methyltransferase-like n=1 Tax=Zingiber officinale TaxID=94328 RepID=UPI001C4CB94C|nr:pre-rRNA 2'-O-ribose RNA methyltransferase-like [Zingiber officinale]XP_042413770.1 pre-rRNA 2'-O-ribose RNA methyltransferase-like [Zingiber officinale]
MGKVKGKQRQDKYYHLAKEQGYRSRASFKLLQLDAKYRFLPSARSVLDLCAAPGGWLQVAVNHAPVGSFIVGVDLFPIRPIRGAHALAEDITTPKCRAAIKRLMDSNGCSAFDVILHDGSPNVGGAWAQEATSQSALVVDSIRLATNFLAPKGTFVTKVFRSQDYSAIIFCLKQFFDKVEVTKPVASRSTSAEIYVIGVRYKAPAKIDPRLLDVKHLFQGAIEQPKVVNVLRGSKQKRNREGYEEGNTTLWKVGLVSDFIQSESSVEFLSSVNALSFDDPACFSFRDHELTTDEIKSLCEDLYVLDKKSFKQLLKWRIHIRNALSKEKVASTANEDKIVIKEDDAKEDEQEDEDDKVLNEMEELSQLMDKKKKKAKKLLSKRRAKDKARKAMGIQIDATEDSYIERDLFSLSAIKGKKELLAIDSTDLNDEYGEDNLVDSDDEEAQREIEKEDSSDEMDSDEEQRRYNEQLEEELDEAYERYVTRKGGSTKERKRAKRTSDDLDLIEEENDGDDLVHPVEESDQKQNKESNPLMVPIVEDEQPTEEQMVERWFGQDVFTEAATDGMLEDSESDEEKEAKIVKVPAKTKENIKQPLDLSLPKSLPKSKNTEQDGFEIVPAEPMETSDDDSSSSDESDDMDDYTKAEILAYAKKMLRKKQREQILDDAYNRYMFDDVGLPKWFEDEEKRHCQPIKPITREEVAAMRAQFREIDARPAKKVAEAKARKKRAAMKKLEKARQKANSIVDQTDISERSKRKMIDQVYKKAEPKKPQKEYVVAKKGVRVKLGKGKVLVDRRMKKDARSYGSGKPGKGGFKKGNKTTKGKKAQKGNQSAKTNRSEKKGKGKGRKHA